jgi:hypothetical protein
MTDRCLARFKRTIAVSTLVVLVATSGVGAPALADDHGDWGWGRHEDHWRSDRERRREWRRERERRAEWRDWRRHRDRDRDDDDDDDDGVSDLLLPGIIGLGAGFLGGYLADQYSRGEP